MIIKVKIIYPLQRQRDVAATARTVLRDTGKNHVGAKSTLPRRDFKLLEKNTQEKKEQNPCHSDDGQGIQNCIDCSFGILHVITYF